jgi:hypothetical protein
MEHAWDIIGQDCARAPNPTLTQISRDRQFFG